MEFSELIKLIKLIKPFNKPIHYLVVGGVLLFLSCKIPAWANYLLVSGSVLFFWGVVEAIEWIRKNPWANYKKGEKIIEREEQILALYKKLNKYEKHIIDYCIARIYIFYKAKNAGEHEAIKTLMIKGFGHIESLADQDILEEHQFPWEDPIYENSIIKLDSSIFILLYQLKGEEIKARHGQR